MIGKRLAPRKSCHGHARNAGIENGLEDDGTEPGPQQFLDGGATVDRTAYQIGAGRRRAMNHCARVTSLGPDQQVDRRVAHILPLALRFDPKGAGRASQGLAKGSADRVRELLRSHGEGRPRVGWSRQGRE